MKQEHKRPRGLMSRPASHKMAMDNAADNQNHGQLDAEDEKYCELIDFLLGELDEVLDDEDGHWQ